MLDEILEITAALILKKISEQRYNIWSLVNRPTGSFETSGKRAPIGPPAPPRKLTWLGPKLHWWHSRPAAHLPEELVAAVYVNQIKHKSHM
jgi:hypothetical protein